MTATTIDADTISVNGVAYVRADSMTTATPPSYADSPIKIVILQRGWVMVGRWGRDGDNCTLDDAKVIERWGTTKGIGELVAGPVKGKTQLRDCGHVEFHILGVVAAISCDEAGWS